MIAGQYRGGNGGLVSCETIARADEARRALAAIEAEALNSSDQADCSARPTPEIPNPRT